MDDPVDVMFLGRPHGFDYRQKSDPNGRWIIQLTSGVPLPFRIHCFGHHIVFDHVGQINALWKLVQVGEDFELHPK